MRAYSSFAVVYDTFMDNVPYDQWADYLHGLLLDNGIRDGLMVDLACGTGSITRRLSNFGYDMIGIDYSEEMLEIAREKEYEIDFGDYEENEYEALDDEEIDINEAVDNPANIDETKDSKTDTLESDSVEFPEYEIEDEKHILYLHQDMREFELFGTVSAVVCICDGMNYIIKEEDMKHVFTLVNNYLDTGGIFIFDMNTEYKYKNLLADNVIAENREDCSFIWENYYDEEKKLNEYNMTLFIKASEDNTNTFERFIETHYQKAYTIERVKELIKEAGMEFVAVYDAFTKNEPTAESERVYFIARERHQDNKKYV